MGQNFKFGALLSQNKVDFFLKAPKIMAKMAKFGKSNPNLLTRLMNLLLLQCGNSYAMEYGRHYFWPRWTRRSTAKSEQKRGEGGKNDI